MIRDISGAASLTDPRHDRTYIARTHRENFFAEKTNNTAIILIILIMAIRSLAELSSSPNMGISPASRTIAKRAKSGGVNYFPAVLKVDLRVHWKEPPVDTIYQYTPSSSEPHVHWREPVVEKVHRYSSSPSYHGRVRAPNSPAESPKGSIPCVALIDYRDIEAS